MDFYIPISVYPSAWSNQGQPMPLAEFMNLGKDRHAADIATYRTMKQEIGEKSEQLDALTAYLDELTQRIDRDANPLGGEDSPAVAALRTERQSVQEQIARLQADIREGGEVVDRLKRSFPCATISGLFQPTRAKANLVHHSGFLCIDIDDHFTLRDSSGKSHTYHQSLDGITDTLSRLPYILYAAHSVGGRGYYAIIPLDPSVFGPCHELTAKDHEWYFDCLKEDFDQMGIVIDPACRDVTRLRFASYDSAPIRNAAAIPYAGRANFVSRNERRQQEAEAARREAAAQRSASYHNNGDRDYAHVEQCVRELSRLHVNIADDYNDWRTVGFSLAATFGERGREFFHAISCQSTKYDRSENDKKYDNFLKSAKGTVTIASLFQLFEKNGIRWYRIQH